MSEAKKTKSEASSSDGGGNIGRGESVVIDVGRRKSSCGYCKSGACTSISHGLWAQTLAVDDYQALLDRGWRRSGCFLYKPEMEKTCCPSYTIRLKASNFRPSKEQARVSKRMLRFLDGTLEVKKPNKLTCEIKASGGSCSNANDLNANATLMGTIAVDPEGTDKAEQCIHSMSAEIDNIVQTCVENGEFSSGIQFPKASLKKVAPSKRKLQAEISEDLIFSCNIAFQIAATLRRTRINIGNVKSFEQYSLGKNEDQAALSPMMIGEILARHLKPLAETYGFLVRACNGHINFYSVIDQVDDGEVGRAKILQPFSTCSGHDHRHANKNAGGSQGQRLRFEIKLKRSSFDYEEYSLYRKYQIRVHNDTPDHVSESSYKRFLVDTPLLHIPPIDDGATPPCGFGSFHQQYLVDGKLVAVGVIDILPKCLSSKYLFWDPDMAFLSLGKFSALEEIKWVHENQMNCPSLQYYFLGYYIHSCQKMRYKTAYRPSELLCPLRYQWVPYDVAKPLLNRRKYVVLSDFSALQNGDPLLLDVLDETIEEQQNEFMDEASNDVFVNEEEMAELDSEDSDDESISNSVTLEGLEADLSNVLIGLKKTCLRYKNIRDAFDVNQRKFIETQLQRYVHVVGRELSERMVYSLG